MELLDVLGVAGFDEEGDAGLGDVGGAEVAVMGDFLDGAAGFADEGEQFGEGAGAVGDVDVEAGEASVGGEAAVNDAGDEGEVDVAAAEDEDDFFALEVGEFEGGAFHDGGEGYGAGTFDDHFFKFEEAEDGFGDLGFIDEDDVVDDALGDLEAELAALGDGEAIGEGGLGGDAGEGTGGEGVMERGGMDGFDADDEGLRAQGFEDGADAGDEAAAADGDDDGVDIGEVVEDFEGHGALAGDDVRVIEGGDVGEGIFVGEEGGVGAGFVEGFTVEDDAGVEGAAVGDFDDGGPAGHDDGDGDFEELAVVGESEGVVTGGGGDDAGLFLGGGELEEFVAGPAFFEGAGHLEVVELAEDLGAAEFGEGEGVRERRVVDGGADAVMGFANVVEGGRGGKYVRRFYESGHGGSPVMRWMITGVRREGGVGRNGRKRGNDDDVGAGLLLQGVEGNYFANKVGRGWL